MKAIIFGAGGQDGFYLKNILEREGVEVIALTRKQCDVGVQGYVAVQIATVKPDYIFHLAATSSTKHDFLRENQYAIVDGSLFIMDAVYAYCPKCKVFLAGSILQLSTVVGQVINQQSNASAYAAQRNASLAMAQYYRRLGVEVYFGFLSHHDSPRRSDQHLAKRIASQAVVAVETSKPIHLKDPLDEKEWNFAGDMMEAVWAQVHSDAYEAVLGSGRTDTIHQYARECLMALSIGRAPSSLIHQEFTREGAIVTRTDDKRFKHHFKTQLSELAKMMVTASADDRTAPVLEPRTCTSQLGPCRLQ